MKNIVVDIRKQSLGLFEATIKSLFSVENTNELFVYVIYNDLSSREIKGLIRIFKEREFTNVRLIKFKSVLSFIEKNVFLDKKEKSFYSSEYLLLFVPHYLNGIESFYWISDSIYFNKTCLDRIKIKDASGKVAAFPLSIRQTDEIGNYLKKIDAFIGSYLQDYYNEWAINTKFGFIDVNKFTKKFPISYLFDYLSSVAYLHKPELILNLILYNNSIILKPDYLFDYVDQRKTYRQLVKKAKKKFEFKYNSQPYLVEIRLSNLITNQIDNYHFQFSTLVKNFPIEQSLSVSSTINYECKESKLKRIKSLTVGKLINYPRLYRVTRYFYRFIFRND